ncbi:hypothetical protein M9435_002941 [Picochlorum sp. BPE23]|nr:hypothetical protein M9435_002941 [Picochlorum sp. BPE23]
MSRKRSKNNSPNISDSNALVSGPSRIRSEEEPNRTINDGEDNFVEDEVDAQLLPSPFGHDSVQSQSRVDAEGSATPDLGAADTPTPERIQEFREQLNQTPGFRVDDLSDHNLVIGPQLGAGSYGRVHQGYHLVHGDVAIKIVDGHDPSTLLSGLREICAFMAMGQHPNIATVFEIRLYQQLQCACLPWATDMPAGPSSITGDGIFRQTRQSWAGTIGLENSRDARMRVAVFSRDPESMLELQVSLRSLEQNSAAIREIYFVIIGEYCNGGTLYEVLRRGALRHENLETRYAFLKAIALSIACAMQHLHQNNITHRDLSNTNVMLHYTIMHEDGKPDKESLTAKLIDFGRASVNAVSATRTNSLSTVSYSAPEFMIKGESSKASDIFSLGVLMWEVWTGCLAWEGANDVQVVFAVTSGRMLEIPADAPRDLGRLMESCLSVESNNRPGIDEVVKELKSFLCLEEEGINTDEESEQQTTSSGQECDYGESSDEHEDSRI